MRFFRYLFQRKYTIKCVCVLMLLKLHGYTSYPHSDRLDIFYWPDGICIDMFVVFGIIVLLTLIIWNQANAFAKVLIDDYREEGEYL